MKFISLTAVAIVATLAAPAIAGPLFFLPDHEPNGWRDSGCDEAANVYITGKNGNVLYLNNPTCPMRGGPSADEAKAEEPAVVIPVEEEEAPVEEVEVIADKG